MELVLIASVGLFFTFIANHLGVNWLRWLMVAQMLIIFTTVRLIFDYGFGLLNIGNIIFANILLIQGVIFFHYGEKDARDTIWKVLYLISTVLIFRFIIVNLADVNLNGELINCYKKIIFDDPSRLIASFLGFYISITLFNILMINLKIKSYLSKYAISTIISQLFDSIFFFFIAFSQSPDFLNYLITGYIVKVIYMFITLPILKLLITIKPTDKYAI